MEQRSTPEPKSHSYAAVDSDTPITPATMYSNTTMDQTHSPAEDPHPTSDLQPESVQTIRIGGRSTDGQQSQDLPQNEESESRAELQKKLVSSGLAEEAKTAREQIVSDALEQVDFSSDAFTVEIQSKLSELLSSADFSLEIDDALIESARTKLPKALEFAVQLSLDEALANHLMHGHKCDPTKSLDVRYGLSPSGSFVVESKDEGNGYSRDEVADPTADENINLASGRGILLIESFTDRVEITDGGRGLKMIFGVEKIVDRTAREALREKGAPIPLD